MATQTQPPIMVRAALTADEWKRLRAIALERDTSAAQLIAAALRATYNLEGATP